MLFCSWHPCFVGCWARYVSSAPLSNVADSLLSLLPGFSGCFLVHRHVVGLPCVCWSSLVTLPRGSFFVRLLGGCWTSLLFVFSIDRRHCFVSTVFAFVVWRRSFVVFLDMWLCFSVLFRHRSQRFFACALPLIRVLWLVLRFDDIPEFACPSFAWKLFFSGFPLFVIAYFCRVFVCAQSVDWATRTANR